MAEDRPPPARVPTLTEVVGEPARGATATEPAIAPPDPEPPIDEARIIGQVLGEVQKRIDLMFEYRVRETLAPLLARLTDDMLRAARDELARTLRDVVSRAVAQELSKRRPR